MIVAVPVRSSDLLGAGLLEKRLELVARQLDVTEDSGKQARADGLTSVDGDRGGSAIVVAEEVMAPFDSGNAKPGTFERTDQLLSRNTKARCHEVTRTR